MNLTFKWPQLDQIDPIFIQNDRIPIENCFFMAFKSKSSLRTMAEDTSLSWESYLERKESIGSTENDQIIIPIMWFKQTARMQWSFYKKMLLSGNVQFYTLSDLARISPKFHCNTQKRVAVLSVSKLEIFSWTILKLSFRLKSWWIQILYFILFHY